MSWIERIQDENHGNKLRNPFKNLSCCTIDNIFFLDLTCLSKFFNIITGSDTKLIYIFVRQIVCFSKQQQNLLHGTNVYFNRIKVVLRKIS